MGGRASDKLTHAAFGSCRSPLCASGNPIIWVSPPWQDMCGYSYDEAVGRNPRMTQGEGTDPHVVRAISSALGEHRACKVQLLNYRGGSSDRPFWNMLTMSPLHHRGELQLFVANLQDYSYHIGKMVSLTPAQFCRAPSHYQRGRRFTGERLGTLMLAKPAIYEADEAFPIAEVAAQPVMPAPVKRLGWSKLQLEPEHLADRLADVFQSIDGCRYEIRQRGTDESDAAVVCAEHDGVAIRVIVAEEPDGQYSIACTRISGNTFAYHSTFRILRERLGHALTEHPLVLPMTDGARRRGDGGGAGIGLAAVPEGRV